MSLKTVKLGHVCKVQSGGMPFNKDNFSGVPTDYQVISPKDVKYGKISAELRYLKSIEEVSKKHFVGDGQILVCGHIVAKRAVAFISGLGDKKIVLHNGIYRLHTDTKKMNPVFIKMFLESDEGVSQINKLSTGVRTNLQRISAEDLRKVNIPMLNLGKQHKLVAQYQKLENEISKAEQAKADNVKQLTETKNHLIIDILK